MANEFNEINVTSDEIDPQLIEKLFPKCRPKNKPNIECNDINQNYKNSKRDKHLLIDLDFINDNTMDEHKNHDLRSADNSCNDCVKSDLASIGFKLDQLLLSPEEEYKSFNHNFINKPFIDNNEDTENEELSYSRDLALRESRIEIAGGREIFSASKSKMNKKKLNSNLLSQNNINNEEKSLHNIKTKRNNTTQTSSAAKEVKDISSETTTNPSVNQLLHSPISDLLTDLSKSVEHKHKLSSGIVVYEDFSSKPDSEIIYDDIEEIDKRELKLSVKPINSEFRKSSPNDPFLVNSFNESTIEDNSNDKYAENTSLEKNEEYFEQNSSNSSEEQISMADESRGIARIIGNVPIAQYDGSPRRYGPKPPGYPQRVINNEEMSVGLNTSVETKGLGDISCDKLVKSILSIPMPYEDSLPDSVTNASNASNGSKSHSSSIQSAPNSEQSDKNDVLMETTNTDNNVYQFSDLDYKLYRMDNVGSSYVGKRLATLSSANSEDDRSVAVSPSKSVNNDPNSMIAHENELILLHERVRQHILNEIVSPVSPCADIETEPEMVDRLGEGNRNFTLSPDITDCDSNEIESELSLEGSLLSNNKIVAMPVLEDGLSSGVPSSDNELEEDLNNDSPVNLSFNKKQMCERLEEELVSKLRAKLKRNDNLSEHQIGYSVHSCKNKSTLNHSDSCRQY